MSRRTLRIVYLALFVLAVLVWAGCASRQAAAPPPPEEKPKTETATETATKTGGLPGYVGSEACGTCHADVYKAWKGTDHSSMLQDMKAAETYIVADMRTLQGDDFKKSDLLYAVAQGKRFLAMKDGKLQYVPKQWDPEKKMWVDVQWREYTCAGCHTAGFDKDTGTWAEAGIGCESCHGPGKEHLAAPNKETIKSGVGNDMCASCHGEGRQGEQLEAMGHTTIFAEQAATNPRYGDSCIQCHSATVIVANIKGKTPPKWETDFKEGALKNDRTGITCVVCHDPHRQTGHEYQLRKDPYETCAQCHTNSGGDLVPGKGPHHPQKQFIEGQYVENGVLNNDMPSLGHKDCASCHMTDGNHFFKVGTPTITLKVHGKDVEFNSCTTAGCHQAMTADRFKAVTAPIAGKIEKLAHDFEAIDKKVKDRGDKVPANVKAVYADVVTNLHLLEAEGSHGIHNMPLAQKLLAKTEKDIAQLKRLVR